MRSLVITLLLACVGGLAAAHAGHGFGASHWHASDLFGPAMLALGGAALWWGRRKK